MKKTTGFEKFANKKKAGTVKEAYRQEKRVERKEREDEINQHYNERRQKKANSQPFDNNRKGDRGKREEKPTVGTGTNPRQARSKFATRLEKTSQQEEKTSFTADRKPATTAPASKPTSGTEPMPLNKFIAHAGVCARREAAELVKQGIVTVNGQLVTEPGFKVTAKDEVKVKGKKVFLSRNNVYILLNKPKDYITTTDDPQGRKTVLDLIKQATDERVYPIGRLDRNTSGVLLLTNDGELAQILSHPKHGIKKVYEVKLDRPLTKTDFETILNGITLEDGFIAPDALGYADPKDKSVIGIEIHSGRNRIVRRIFEHLKYDVKGLDRVMFAGLTKKNVNRGRWRYLNEKEVRILKHFNKSAKKQAD